MDVVSVFSMALAHRYYDPRGNLVILMRVTREDVGFIARVGWKRLALPNSAAHKRLDSSGLPECGSGVGLGCWLVSSSRGKGDTQNTGDRCA